MCLFYLNVECPLIFLSSHLAGIESKGCLMGIDKVVEKIIGKMTLANIILTQSTYPGENLHVV